MTKNTKHTVQVTLAFSTAGVSALARLMAQNTSFDLSETLEEALLFKDIALRTSEQGGAVKFEAADGAALIFSGDSPTLRQSN